MMGLLMVAGYLAVAFWTWRASAMNYLDRVAQQELAERQNGWRSEYRRSEPLVADYERSYAVSMGAVSGLGWPLYWAVSGALALLGAATGGWTSATEVAELERERKREEMQALRELAHDNGLPMPEGDA